MEGLASYIVFFFVIALIYGILTLGLNLQWGFCGLFNIGVAGFFAVGAYTSAILTTSAAAGRLGGFGLPFPVGFAAAGLAAGLCAFIVGIPTLRLKGDFLAIATIGIAETIRLILNNEPTLAHGVRGLAGIPRPLAGLFNKGYNLFYLIVTVAVLAALFFVSRKLAGSPWGRVVKAIREDELVASSLGKNVFRFKMESLVVGSVFMGFAGSLYAHFIRFISPEVFLPLSGTFLVWVMLVAGGSGSNLGAVIGAVFIWGVWSATDLIVNLVPATMATKAGALRVIAVALVLEILLVLRPQGIAGDKSSLIPPRE